MAKLGLPTSPDPLKYTIERGCQNCGESNSIHIPKGIKIKDHLVNTVKENQICHVCGCYVIEYMERI